jgi:hypothetical protein
MLASRLQLPQNPRPRSALGGDVVGVVELAGLEAEATAADAAIEIVAQCLQLRDAAVEAFADGFADLPPVETGGIASLGQAAQVIADFFEREPQLLHDQDKAEPPDIAAQEAPLVARGAEGFDQSLVLVKADRRGGKAGPARQIADAEVVVRIHRSE